MNQRVLSKFDLITVGETPGVTTEEAKKYANLDGSELNMVFQFEHMGTTDGKYGKWTTKKPEMKKVRAVMNKWQNDLEGKVCTGITTISRVPYLDSVMTARCTVRYLQR